MKRFPPRLLLKMAFRNIWLHKLRTTVIGLIIVFGALLAVVGNSLVDSVANGISNSVIHSSAGHIQIYSAEAKEKLAIFGDTSGNVPEIGHVNDFARVKKVLLESIPEIQAIVPMGTNLSFANPGNLLDDKLEKLRKSAIKSESEKEHIRAIIADIQSDVVRNSAFFEGNQDTTIREAIPNLQIASSEGFWKDFDANAEQKIEFLANRIAPLIFDDNQLFFQYIGTDPQLFKKTFPAFEIVKGQDIPEGERGYLFADYFYERFVKNRVAYRLDTLHQAIDKNGEKISESKTLQDLVAANTAQAAEIYTQIPPAQARALTLDLKKMLSSQSEVFADLVREFLTMSDQNFSERYRYFYDRIAPHILLYRVKIGELFPITAFAKTGFASSVNVRVYGTFRFKSFESSPLAGNFGLMDLVSFRKLYGFLTEDRRAENEELEKEMGALDVGREDLDRLFQDSVVREPTPKRSATVSPRAQLPPLSGQSEQDRRYTSEELESGPFLHAAIVLKKAQEMGLVLQKIRDVSEREKLGIQALPWDQASGTVGQLSFVVRAILYACVGILFFVATFIIMNSMLMAAIERTKEIGTMRAMGAQKNFIFGLLLYESVILSLIFGLIGSLLGVGIVLYLKAVGIPAVGDVATFFFSGPRLYPQFSGWAVVLILFLLAIIATISTLYPAWRAMKITPLEAMRRGG